MNAAAKARARLGVSLEAFSVVPFRWVWCAALSGNSGRFAVILVGGWEAYRLGGHSAFWASFVAFLLLIPSMALGLLWGSFADRINRAKMAAAGQSVNALACAACAALVASHLLSLGALLGLVALVGVGNSIQGPAWQALVPALVGNERMMNAAAAIRIAQQGAELVGPAIATAILTTLGPGATFVLCAVLYAIGVALVTRVLAEAPRPQAGSVKEGVTVIAKGVQEGVRYVRSRGELRLLFFWVALHCSLTMASFGILPTIAAVDFHGHAAVYGLLLTSFGVGAIVGPLMMMLGIGLGSRGRLLFVTGLLSGLPLVGLGLTHAPWFAFLMSGLAGLGQSVFMATIYACVMSCATEQVRGRVSSVQLSLTTGAMGAASLGWGALVSVISAGSVLVLPGLAFTAVCLGVLRALPWLDRRLDLASARAPAPVLATDPS